MLCSGKRWGVQTDLARRTVAPEAVPLPAELLAVAQRMRDTVPQLADFHPNEANAIEYLQDRGDYLLPHVDDRCDGMQHPQFQGSCGGFRACLDLIVQLSYCA